LETLVTDCLGICYSAFSENEQFARAHVLRQIVLMVYGSSNDDVYNFLQRECFHHHLKEGMKLSLPELINHHIDLLSVKKDDNFPAARLSKAIQISAHHLKYDHKHKLAIDFASKAGWSQQDISLIQKACDGCKAAAAIKEAENSSKYSDSVRSNQWDAYAFSKRYAG
jgi:hypothetical protein